MRGVRANGGLKNVVSEFLCWPKACPHSLRLRSPKVPECVFCFVSQRVYVVYFELIHCFYVCFVFACGCYVVGLDSRQQVQNGS